MKQVRPAPWLAVSLEPAAKNAEVKERSSTAVKAIVASPYSEFGVKSFKPTHAYFPGYESHTFAVSGLAVDGNQGCAGAPISMEHFVGKELPFDMPEAHEGSVLEGTAINRSNAPAPFRLVLAGPVEWDPR